MEKETKEKGERKMGNGRWRKGEWMRKGGKGIGVAVLGRCWVMGGSNE
jgi:hypothetical protein